MKSNTYRFAERELSILSKSAVDPNNRPIIEPFKKEILALCDRFGKSGQSGGSAPYTASAICQALKKLLLQNPICPVMGVDEEWIDDSDYHNQKEALYQNNRCSGLFKYTNGDCYYIDAILWKEENGNTYYGNAFTENGEWFHSRQKIKSFPFTPKTFYIDVVKQILPEEWNQEPFIEWNYYDTAEFEKTGIKTWKTEKYRNVIRDPNQLKRAFKYYDVQAIK